MSDTDVRMIIFATVAAYQELKEFQLGVIIGTQKMGHNIPEVAMKFGFAHATLSRAYRKYRDSGKTCNL